MPRHFKRAISIVVDNEGGRFVGMPTVWREMLHLSPTMSINEIDISGLDEHIAPQPPTSTIRYQMEQQSETAFLISKPTNVKHEEFKVEVDPNSATGFRGLP